MIACLDTTVFVDLRGRGGGRLKSACERMLLELAEEGPPVTTRITVAELYVEMELSDRPAAEEAAIRAALVDMEVLEFHDDAARQSAAIHAHLRRGDKLVGDMDILIAAIALTRGHSIVTRNPKHFRDVPGLTVIEYANAASG